MSKRIWELLNGTHFFLHTRESFIIYSFSISFFSKLVSRRVQFHLLCWRLLKLQCSDNPNLVCPINYSTNALPCHIAVDVRARDVCMHYSDDRRDNLEEAQHERCSKSNDSTSKMFYAITHSQRKPLWLLLGLICSLLHSFLLKMWQN